MKLDFLDRDLNGLLWRMSGVIMAVLLAFLVSPAAHAGTKVTMEDVLVGTPDGTAEATLAYPAADGKYPAVILWPDIVGSRPIFREMAREFAAEGYVVLVPNSFYRSMRPGDAELDPWDKETRPILMQYRAEATDDDIARDTAAYLAFLDSLERTDKAKKAAAIGYDLGGSYAFRAAAAAPERIAVVASVYGLGVATARPNSPHLLVPESKADYYVAISKDDDTREPQDKDDIREAIDQGGLEGTVEVYEANHGWANPAAKAYDAKAADRSFQSIVALLKRDL